MGNVVRQVVRSPIRLPVRSVIRGVPAFLSQSLAHLNGDNILKSAGAVIQRTNIGRGGAGYDEDVVLDTGANLRESIHAAMLLYGAIGDYASSPNSVAASITGNLGQKAIDVVLDNYASGNQALGGKRLNTGDQRSFSFSVNSIGKLRVDTSTDGTLANITSQVSTAAVTTVVAAGGKISVWADLDVDNGAGDSDLTFYYSIDSGITWIQFGDVVNSGGVLSIFDGTAVVSVGAVDNGATWPAKGSIGKYQILNGSTLAVDFNAADQTSDTGAPFTSSTTGEEWTPNGNAKIQNSGHSAVATIGSAALETTAGQDIAVFTRYITMRFDVAAPGADQVIFDARSDATKSVRVFTDQSDSNKLTLDAGGTPIVVDATYAAGTCIITVVSNGASSLLRVSGAIVGEIAGNPGSEALDFGTSFGNLSGALTWSGLEYSDITFNTAHSALQQAVMEAYLTARYSL